MPRHGHARGRLTASAIAAAIAAACASGPHGPPFLVIDLIRWFRLADARPAQARFELAQHTLHGDARASLVVPVPSRIVWQLHVPRRATLRVSPALLPSASTATVHFRVGVSDTRIYERLGEATITGGGPDPLAHDMVVDLSAYAGRKWSLFYRPEETAWRLVLSADHVEGHVSQALWFAPAVYADIASARHFHARLRQRRIAPVDEAVN